MCGRAYSTYTDEELAYRVLNKKKIKIPEIKPNYNFSPTQLGLIQRVHQDVETFEFFRWGLLPSWASDPKMSFKLINARSETVHEKPSFRSAFKSQRCVAYFSGFFEWKREGESKRPFAIHHKSEPVIALAGLWELNEKATGEAIHSFCILTTTPNSIMEKIHDRMPVILNIEQEQTWLSPKSNPETLKSLFRPCPSEWLESFEVSTRVNSPKNNTKENLEPLPS